MSEKSGEPGYESYERARDVQRAETLISPEQRAEVIETIAELLYKIVEVGPGVDPAIVKSWRAQLKSALVFLGIDLDKPHWGILYGDMIWRVAIERELPSKPQGFPPFEEFASMTTQLIIAEENVGGNIFDDLKGRDGKGLAEYLYGLGLVMSSQLSYNYIFPPSDPIAVNPKTGEIEGRHRWLTLAVLNELGFDTRQWYWVHVERQGGK